MPERDYFDIPDDEPARAEAKPVILLPHTETQRDDELVILNKQSHFSGKVIAVIVFLLVIGGCIYLVVHQIQQDTKPHKASIQAKGQ